MNTSQLISLANKLELDFEWKPYKTGHYLITRVGGRKYKTTEQVIAQLNLIDEILNNGGRELWKK